MTRRLFDDDKEAGIKTWFEFDPVTRKNILTTEQDCTAIVEANKAIQNDSNGWSKSRFLRHAASIPLTVLFKWLNEEGINAFDRNHRAAVFKKLDSNEYRHLRTANWRLGKPSGS